MLHLLHLIKSHCWYVFFVVGLAFLWVSSIESVDTERLLFHPREHPSWLGVGLGAVCLALGIVLLYFSDKIRPAPSVAGRWRYQVTNGSNEFSHSGECQITQHGTRLQINGTRKFSCQLLDGNLACTEVTATWNSRWGEVCTDGRVRFDYDISIGDERFVGYCSVHCTADPRKEMAGNYYMLPPFNPELLNARHGTIVFQPMKRDEALRPPGHEELRSLKRATSSPALHWNANG